MAHVASILASDAVCVSPPRPPPPRPPRPPPPPHHNQSQFPQQQPPPNRSPQTAQSTPHAVFTFIPGQALVKRGCVLPIQLESLTQDIVATLLPLWIRSVYSEARTYGTYGKRPFLLLRNMTGISRYARRISHRSWFTLLTPRKI